MAGQHIRVIFFDLGETLVTSGRAWLPGGQALVASLKSHGHRLGIISNTGSLTCAAILNLLPTDFDVAAFETGLVLFSSEVGVEKPAPQIFEKAVEAAAAAASQCLYCSENAVETLVAQHVGLRALRVQSPPHNDLPSIEQYLADFHAQL